MRTVELFCGAGGLSYGLKSAGFSIVGAFDNEPTAVETYNLNLRIPGLEARATLADVSDIAAIVPKIMELKPDLIAGGPPCQDYSSAGKRMEAGNAKLTVVYAAIAAAVRPEWILMENVIPALKSNSWQKARAILENAGYGLSVCKLDFSRYGVPQSRRRLIVVGRMGERHGFLESDIHGAASKTAMTVRKYFVQGGHRQSGFVFPHISSYWDCKNPLRKSELYSRPFTGGRPLRSTDEPMATVIKSSGEKPSPKVIAALSEEMVIRVLNAKVLSLHQLQEVQGFPGDWRWPKCSNVRIMKMIANGVPKPAAERIGRVILARHRGQSIPEPEGRFEGWLTREKGISAATAHNVTLNVRRAWKLLRGRTFADINQELVALESAEGFGGLSTNTKSGLRQALRQYSVYLESKVRRRENREPLEKCVSAFDFSLFTDTSGP